MASSVASRIKAALAVLVKGDNKSKELSVKSGVLYDIYGREILDGSDYFHPNQVKGIPVFDTDSVLEQHRGYVKEIERICGVGDHRKTNDGKELRKELFEMVVRRFIEYVHLLPASESHHHSVPGGMLIHALETSSWSLRSAKNVRPATSGRLDVDKMLEPSYRYAAWVGGLMHDIGKLTSDMNVFAVSTYDKETKTNKKVSDIIPHWHPEKESLITWAKRYDIATYSVSFKGDRIHNQHNSVTSSLMSPILGDGVALDRLLTSPINVHHELSKVLNGTDSKCDYLRKAIRVGDNKSTGENLKVFQHLKMGPGKLSRAAMIFRAIQWSRPNWLINKPNGHAWVIGDDIYLRYTSAFDIIQKEAEKNSYQVTSESQGLLEVMVENNMIEKYSESSWSVKYAGGIFTENDISEIRSGKKTIGWESVVKVIWRGVVFGSDPVPDCAPGVMLLPDNELMILVRTDGTTQEFPAPNTKDVNKSPQQTKAKVSDTQQKQGVIIEHEKPLPTDVKSLNANTEAEKKVKNKTKSKAKKKNPALDKKEDKTKENPVKSNKGLVFKNAPKKSPTTAVESLPSEVVEFWCQAVFVKRPPNGMNLINLNDSAKVLGMSAPELATKAKNDGVVIPNPSAPLKVVTIYENEPCLNVLVSAAVIESEGEAEVKKIDPLLSTAPIQDDKSKKEDDVNECDSNDIWVTAKANESDHELKILTSAATKKHSLGYALSVVIEAGSESDCLIQTENGLLLDAGLVAKAIQDSGKYVTRARTICTALVSSGLVGKGRYEELFLVPYEQINEIKLRMRACNGKN
jgi:hypothetical protein